MTGPKHLWSGDWETESDKNAAQRAERPAPAPDPLLEPEPEQNGRRRLRAKPLAAGVVVLLVLAGVAVALVLSSGGSKTPPAGTQTTATGTTSTQNRTAPGSSGGVTPAQSNPAPVVTGPSAQWLGMQIVSSPSGAVVDTVRAGSVSDADGFEPGDVITEVGGDPVNTVRDLGAATANVPLGKRLVVTVDRGSSTLSTAVTLKVRPTIRP